MGGSYSATSEACHVFVSLIITDPPTGVLCVSFPGRVTFYWAVDESKQILRAGVAAQTAGWLGVGFNAFPEMTGADIVTYLRTCWEDGEDG